MCKKKRFREQRQNKKKEQRKKTNNNNNHSFRLILWLIINIADISLTKIDVYVSDKCVFFDQKKEDDRFRETGTKKQASERAREQKNPLYYDRSR